MYSEGRTEEREDTKTAIFQTKTDKEEVHEEKKSFPSPLVLEEHFLEFTQLSADYRTAWYCCAVNKKETDQEKDRRTKKKMI